MREDQAEEMLTVLRSIDKKLGGAAASGGKAGAAGTTSGKKTAVTREMALAAMKEVKDTMGAPAAKKIMKEVAGTATFTEIDKAKYGALFDKAKEVMAGGEEETETQEEDDGL